MSTASQQQLFSVLVELADSATQGVDLVELADTMVHGCVELLPVSAAGVMLDDQRGSLRVFASTNETSRLLELLEIQNDEGPCLDAFRSNEPIAAVDLTRFRDRWPRFVSNALSVGIHTTYALPMRLRDQSIGALNLFLTEEAPLSVSQLQVAEVMNDIAAIGIINQWTIQRQRCSPSSYSGHLTRASSSNKLRV